MQPVYLAFTIMVVVLPAIVSSTFPNCPHPLKQVKDMVKLISWFTDAVVAPSIFVTGALAKDKHLSSSFFLLQLVNRMIEKKKQINLLKNFRLILIVCK